MTTDNQVNPVSEEITLDQKRDDLAQTYYHRTYQECCWAQKLAIDQAIKISPN